MPTDFETLKLGIVEDAYQAASGQKSWKQFLHNFDAFPSIKISMMSHNNTFTKFDNVISHNFDPDFIQSYINYFYDINPKSAYAQEMLTNSKGTWGHWHVSPETLKKTEYYNDWLLPQGNISAGYGFNLHQGKEKNISVISQGSFEYLEELEQIERLMQDIGSHVKRALLVQEQLSYQQLNNSSYEHVLNCLQNPVLLTDKAGKLYFANKWAEKLLSQGDLIYLSHGRTLTFKNSTHQKMAKRQLQNLTSGIALTDSINLQLYTKEGTFFNLFASPITVTPSNSENFDSFWKTPGHIAWFFISPRSLPNISEELIATVLSVTPTEAKLALALLNNKSLTEYSKEQSVKVSTARGQLKTLREKTSTRNKEELVGLLVRIFGAIKM